MASTSVKGTPSLVSADAQAAVVRSDDPCPTQRTFRPNWGGVAAAATTAVPPTPAVTAAKLPAASTATTRRASRVVPHRLGPVNGLPRPSR